MHREWWTALPNDSVQKGLKWKNAPFCLTTISMSKKETASNANRFTLKLEPAPTNSLTHSVKTSKLQRDSSPFYKSTDTKQRRITSTATATAVPFGPSKTIQTHSPSNIHTLSLPAPYHLDSNSIPSTENE